MTDKVDVVEGFRSSLQDLVTIAEKLEPFCVTTKDLIGICKLAIENDGQLGMVMTVMKASSQVKR